MLQLVVHPAVKRFPYGLSNIYTSLGIITTFSTVEHTYYCILNLTGDCHYVFKCCTHILLFSIHKLFRPQSCIFASCLYPFFNDPTHIVIESCEEYNKPLHVFSLYFLFSQFRLQLFICILSNISSYTQLQIYPNCFCYD